MHKPLILPLLLFLFFHQISAQQFSQKWGSIGEAEFDLQVYEKDPEAAALILYDMGDSFFDITPEGLRIRFERRKRIKILKEEGVAYADISIPYYKDGYGKTEIVSGIQAIAYNSENGELIMSKLGPDDIFEEKTSENWHQKKFAIPNAKVGSIIEFKYKLETPFMYNLPKWYFQDRIPTVLSRYVVRMVPFYEYSFIGQGLTQQDLKGQTTSHHERSYAQVKFKDAIYTFEKKDIAGFKDESFITSINDHIIKLDFQLAKVNSPRGGTREISTTWPKLVDDLRRRESFGKYIKKSSKLAEKILESKIDLNGMSQEKKAQALINYVKRACRWDGSLGKSASHSPKEFSTQQNGNIGDINLFLVALLRAAGIKATPVISSTRNHGRIDTDYPFEHFFNYTLVLVETDSKTFLTDGTAYLLNYNRIPTRSINSLGLVVDEGEGKWISLQTKGYSLNKKTIRTSIDVENKHAKTSMSIQCTDFEAARLRKQFKNDTDEMESEFENYGFESIDLLKTMNYEKVHIPYTLQIEGETSVGFLGETLVINPLLGFPLQKNELTQAERTYPVDFIYAQSDEFVATIGIPENYTVETLPENYTMDNGLAEIFITYEKQEKVIEIKAKYYFKKAVYQPEEYKRVKSYRDMIIQKFNQEIIMKKAT